MRAALAILLLVVAPVSAGAAPCAWDDTGVPPLRTPDGSALFARSYTCPPDAQGTLRIELTASAGKNTVPAGELEADVEPRGKWLRTKKITDWISYSQFCEAKPDPKTRRHVRGIGSAQRVVYDVTLRAKAIGTGDMQALAWEGKTIVPCDACDYSRGSIALTEGRAHVSKLSKKTRITASAKRAWVECARPGATLSLRFFADRDGIPARNALRPVHVVEGLERFLKTKGEKIELDRPAPMAEICRAVGRGRHRMMWEVAGIGELMRIGGGGRSWIDVRCP
ncbi:MAG: hypothetical protein V3T05_08020 [Myxococcota bacterium]